MLKQKKSERDIRIDYPFCVKGHPTQQCQSSIKISKKGVNGCRYLVPKDLTAYQFSFILRKRLKLPKDQSIWLFVNGKYALKADTLMHAVYERHKDKDGFLYMTYSGENTYGA